MKKLSLYTKDIFFIIFSTSFWLTVIAHFTMSPKLFFLFQVFHNHFIRDYYSIIEGMNQEYGIWPGLLKSMAHDFTAIIITFLTVMIPTVLINKFLDRKYNIAENLLTYIIIRPFTLVFIYLGGAIVMSIITAIITSFGFFLFSSPINHELANILEISSSGIALTNFAVCSLFFINFDDSKGFLSDNFIINYLITLAIAIISALFITFTVDMNVDLIIPDNPGNFTVSAYDALEHKILLDESEPDIYEFKWFYNNQDSFSDNTLFTTASGSGLNSSWKEIFIHGENLPFISQFTGFFYKRPDSINFDIKKQDLQVKYYVSNYKNRNYYTYTFSDRKTIKANKYSHPAGKKAYYKHIFTRGSNELFGAEINLKNIGNGGFYIKDEKNNEYYILYFDKKIEFGKFINDDLTPLHVFKNIDSSNIKIIDELYGFSILSNQKPVFFCERNFSEVYIITELNETKPKPFTINYKSITAISQVRD